MAEERLRSLRQRVDVKCSRTETLTSADTLGSTLSISSFLGRSELRLLGVLASLRASSTTVEHRSLPPSFYIHTPKEFANLKDIGSGRRPVLISGSQDSGRYFSLCLLSWLLVLFLYCFIAFFFTFCFCALLLLSCFIARLLHCFLPVLVVFVFVILFLCCGYQA